MDKVMYEVWGEDKREEQEEQYRRMMDFEYSHLCELVVRLNSRLLSIVEQDEKGNINEKEVKLLEMNENIADCYSSLSLQYIRGVKNERCCLVFIEIEFKDEGRMSSSCFVGTPNQIRRQFSYKKGEKFVREIVDRMIVEFFR